MWDGGAAIANGEIGSGIIEKVTSEPKAVYIPGASILWLEGTDNAKALRWEYAWKDQGAVEAGTR